MPSDASMIERPRPGRNAPPTMLVVPGDGIGEEVTREAVRVFEWFAKRRGIDCDLRHEEFGVGSYHRTGRFMREGLLADMVAADAVLFGAVGGGAEHAAIPQAIRRNEGLPRIRREMEVYANLRPVKALPALAKASPLRAEITAGVDMVVVRELVGGIYFGEPRGIETLPDGDRRGVNTHVYTGFEIRRIGRAAFELARRRDRRVTSVDKANVMEAGALWRDEMQKLRDADYPEVALNHLYVDNAAMQIVREPRQFDVLVTDNLFGDILADCAAAIAGSLGMLPSASISDPHSDGRRRGLYEPVHGSAPDIAGENKANPLAAILSLAMALEITFDRPEEARLLERAVEHALAAGKRTADLAEPGCEIVSTSTMGDAVLAALHALTE